MEKTSSEILLEAADLLEQGKWHQGSLFQDLSSECSMCAHGAIAYCGNPHVKKCVDTHNIGNAIGLALRQMVGCTTNPINNSTVALAHHQAYKLGGVSFNFNDDPATTKQNVIDGLRKAAQIEI